MVTFPDPYALAIFYAFILQEGSLQVVRVKNRFLEKADPPVVEPQGNEMFEYKDVLINVNVQDHIVEIQLALANLADLKSCMHPFYKVARTTCFEEVASQAIFAPPHKISNHASDHWDCPWGHRDSIWSVREPPSLLSTAMAKECSTSLGTPQFDPVLPGIVTGEQHPKCP